MRGKHTRETARIRARTLILASAQRASDVRAPMYMYIGVYSTRRSLLDGRRGRGFWKWAKRIGLATGFQDLEASRGWREILEGYMGYPYDVFNDRQELGHLCDVVVWIKMR